MTALTVSPDLSSAPVREGEVVAGKYRVERLLGEGGMGVVVAARHLALGEPVALKFVLGGRDLDREVMARMMREARATFRLRSEHTVRVLDVGELPSGALYIVMELLDGRDLAKAREESGPFPLGDVLHIVGQVCSALAASHAKGIVHRDLKPENVFLIRRGEDAHFVKLLDFGIAKLSGGELTDKPQTRAGMILGTPEYMSPEQAGGRPVDYRSDIYSLGVVMYWLLSDQLPYRGNTFGELMVKQLTTPPETLPDRTPAGEPIPPVLGELVRRCLEREPQRRVQSAGEIAEALEKLTEGGGSGRAASLPAPARPRRWLVPSLAAGIVVGLLAALGVWRLTATSAPESASAAGGSGEAAQAKAQLAPEAKAPLPSALPAVAAPIAAAAPPLPPTPAAAPVPPPAPAPAAPQVPVKLSAKEPQAKPKAARPHRRKPAAESAPSSSPDDNTGMIDPFAN